MPLEANNRRKIAIYLLAIMKDLDIPINKAARAVGVEPRRLRNMHKKYPQARILAPLAAYIEGIAREKFLTCQKHSTPKTTP
jgi:hypothetical protein